jgi:adenylate cyclase
LERRLTAILAADVVGYTALMGTDEAGTLRRLTELREEILRPLIAEHRGRIVKLMGDGLLVEFASVVDTVACATAWQEKVAKHQADHDAGSKLQFRIGVNLGDVIVEDDDIHGDGVNIAARLERLAEPGGICLSGDAYRQAKGKIEAEFEDMGERDLKNVAEPVRVYRIAADGSVVADPSPTTDTLPLPEKPSIAVLPFTNMSGDPEQEYFSDGITEDIITDLSQVSGLFVVARNSTFTYKDKPVKVQQVSKDLNVRYVVEGSVRKAGNRVRISAQLIDGVTSGHLWAHRYDRDLTDIFAVQDEIAHSIAEALEVRLLPNESKAIKKIPTEDIEAYQFYLRGREFFNRHTKTSYDSARKMFSKAIELDPNYARAYAGIADCNTWLYEFYGTSVPLEEALAASAKALELDEELAEAHASRGSALAISGKYEMAEREFETAIRLDPNLFDGYYFYGWTCFAQGKFDQAARFLKRASEAQPDDFQSLMLLATTYRALGRQQDGEAADRRAFERAERELHLRPENARAAYVAAGALVSMGEPERAKEWASRALSMEPDDHLTLYNVACVYSLLGELDQAIDLLERSSVNRTSALKDWVKHDNNLDPLRDHPRFQAWMRNLDEQNG